ncbi:MAG: MAPEG family protein [Gammaproteobacteria bacterium]
MEESRLLIPFFGMLLLTVLVWVYMYVRRIGYMLKNKIPVRAGSTPQKMASVVPEEVQNSANNFNNLFQVPILFYVVVLYLLWAGQVDQIHVACAWLFFLARALHSAIQCTVNVVMARFIVYSVASISLWVMILRAAFALH